MISFVLNGTIALLLIIYISYKKDLYSLFFSLFIYLSLHYSYVAFGIFEVTELHSLHGTTQVGAKLTGIGFILFVIIVLILRYRMLLIEQIFSGASKVIVFLCSFWFLAVVIHWVNMVLNGRYPSRLSIQNIFSTCLLCIIFIGCGVVLSQRPSVSKDRLERFCKIVIFLLLTILFIGIYQIISHHAWNFTYINESDRFVWRASSILFNANLLGFWCAMVALFAGYIYHMRVLSQKISILIIFLCSIGIFLSGSRSSLLIGFLAFSIVTILLFFQKEKRLPIKNIFLPIGVFVFSIISFIVIVKSGMVLTNDKFDCIEVFSLLGDRFLLMPFEILGFLLNKISTHSEAFSRFIPALQSLPAISVKSAVSITGRFSNTSGDDIDNGYLLMLDDAGWFGLLIWGLIWSFFIYIGIKVLIISPGVRSIYSLSVILVCIFAAIFARVFQVFPFWLIIAMAVGLSFAWFQIVLSRHYLCKYITGSDATS